MEYKIINYLFEIIKKYDANSIEIYYNNNQSKKLTILYKWQEIKSFNLNPTKLNKFENLLRCFKEFNNIWIWEFTFR